MRIVLVEDHLAYLDSFRLAITTLSTIDVVGQAARARDAFEVIESTAPDLVVSDLMLPDTNAVSLARELRRRQVAVPFMVLTRLGHPMLVRDAMRAGIKGFALKRESLPDLVAAIRRVGDGETYLSPTIQEQMAQHDPGADRGFDKLSHREREIFCFLLEGLTTKEIARLVYLSPKTVDAHRLHINRKLGVRTPAELAKLVADAGLIT